MIIPDEVLDYFAEEYIDGGYDKNLLNFQEYLIVSVLLLFISTNTVLLQCKYII